MLTLKSTLSRVPGNRAHVDLLFQKFDEDANIDFDSLDIAVNAVATAVKDFFFKVGGYSNVGLGSLLRGEPGLTTFRSQGCP